VVEGHNFTQGTPHTAIYAGQTGLTFRSCNLLNCDMPADAVIVDCLYPAYTSFCSHLHPRWAEKGYIATCVESCSHVAHVDTVTIDGVAVDTNRSYADTGVA